VYSGKGGAEAADGTGIVVIHGAPERVERVQRVPVRIHSACLYGEVLHSTDCDCHGQLEEAYTVFAKENVGVLIYLNQEGRGAGLWQKARAYRRQQDECEDTAEAYHGLGIPVDQRDYSLAVTVLEDLNVSRISLLTNNPSKIGRMKSAGIDVERSALVRVTRGNEPYLRAKRLKLGHLIEITAELPALGSSAG
jgi:GTP cyclohydrolase II